MAQRKITWKGLQDDSVENCLVSMLPDGIIVSSGISGKNLNVRYNLRIDPTWLTYYCELRGYYGEFDFHFVFERNQEGKWSENGQPDDRFHDCEYVDISLTPFTNTLPVNRMQLEDHASRDIRVIYFDFPERQVKVVKQRYTKLATGLYHYENIPNDFEADIQVDSDGFVTEYPGLFTRLPDDSYTAD